MTQTNDELKALLALGIIASLAVEFQLSQAGIKFFILPPLSITMEKAEFWSEGLVLVVFGLYIVGFTLSLGFEPYRKFKVASKWLKQASDLLFTAGAFTLILLGLVYFVRLSSLIP